MAYIVNDGEFGKPSCATYVKDLLEGSGGESAPINIRDFTEYPGATSSSPRSSCGPGRTVW